MMWRRKKQSRKPNGAGGVAFFSEIPEAGGRRGFDLRKRIIWLILCQVRDFRSHQVLYFRL